MEEDAGIPAIARSNPAFDAAHGSRRPSNNVRPITDMKSGTIRCKPRSGFCAPAVVGSKRPPRRPRRPATKAASRYKTSAPRDGVRSLLVIGCRGLKNAIHCTAFTLPVLRSRGRRAIGLPVDPQGRGAACLLRPGFAPDHASPAGRVESPHRAESAGTVRRSTRRREQSTGRETENHLPRLLNQRSRRSAQPA